MRFFFVLFFLGLTSWSVAKDEKDNKYTKEAVQPSPWGNWIEQDFPFFSSVLDAREVGEGFPKDNLTPRGIILNLGHNLWACFDTDLLRIACIWESPGDDVPPITMNALAPGSYHVAGQKTKDGQEDLPKPIGKVWLANGIYPGWQVGEKPSLVDPREAGESKEEVGRGAVSSTTNFGSLSIGEDGLVIRYQIEGVSISETISARPGVSGPRIERSIRVDPRKQHLSLLLGKLAEPLDEFQPVFHGPDNVAATASSGTNGLVVSIPPSNQEVSFVTGATRKPSDDRERGCSAPSKMWPQVLATSATLSKKTDPFVLDDIPLPLDNPWKRHVRLADLDFLDDQGNAVGVTFDGDVWLIGGLKGDLKKVTWKRFASGLHEPMSVVVRKSEAQNPKSEILVFDRNGIWKLLDTNNDRECDRYEMFCNLFAQTAETREFPNSMKLGPQGELYISKGGQQGTTFGKHNGTVIKVAPDGKSYEVIGHGLRQPFIGVHPKTGLVTASDQQGHYVPSTPLHLIEKNQFYGHLPTIAEKEKYPEPITEPLTWIPHPVNPSGVTQVWLTDARLGPINDELIHIGYNRPELFRVVTKGRATGSVANGQAGSLPHAAIMSFWRDFDFPPLNAKVNPADGQLYITGFQVWGTTAKRISGLARLRHTGAPRVLLKECTPTEKGIILRFNLKLDAKLAANPDSYSAERWNYKRTAEYGSPHLKLDGSTGQEWMTPSSAYLSKDGMSVLIGIPDMKAGVHQMRIGWGLKSEDGLKAENTAYFSPWELECSMRRRRALATSRWI
jgi:hypothetical protein